MSTYLTSGGRVMLILASALVLDRTNMHRQLPTAEPNENRVTAGTFDDGVYTITLEAKNTIWYPDGDSLPGMAVEAFAEAGNRPTAPGPLLRVPSGTAMRVTVRNTLPRDTLTFYLPLKVSREGATGLDSVVIPSGEARELRFTALTAGNYAYRANARKPIDRVLGMRGLLGGALIVDSPGVRPHRHERVLVLLDVVDSLTSAGVPDAQRSVLAVNGRSWPHTERIAATVGDSLHWRIINASPSVHPMHLHGFYFHVNAFDGPGLLSAAQLVNGRMAVTERMTPFTTMSILWIPERAGNWLFHCHYQPHASPHRPLGNVQQSRTQSPLHHENHAQTGMGGLVVGIHVQPRQGTVSPAEPRRPMRRLRLVATRDSGFPDSLPSMRFIAQDAAGANILRAGRTGISMPIHLVRGEPVTLTVVNELAEPTSVHWHGIELESYFDGVAGFAGQGTRLAPIIAPRDSFDARFTPPRSGTFIYHAHVDEERQHRAGLIGALIVHDRADVDTTLERLFVIKSARGTTMSSPMEINGVVDPDTVVLQVGRAYRLRFIGMAVTSPNAAVYLTARPDSSLANLRDTMLVTWRPVAKDGADLPQRDRTLRPAQQVVSIGETYDFEFIPRARGQLRIEVRPISAGRLFVRVPVRVE